MRAMLVENKKYTLDEIWDAIITYSTDEEKPEEHYFEVEMFDINKENTDLLNEREYENISVLLFQYPIGTHLFYGVISTPMLRTWI